MPQIICMWKQRNAFFCIVHLSYTGTVPGAVVYGAATDAGCLIWKTDCGENTSCWIYDISVVGRNYFIITIITKVLSLTFFFCAIWFYKPPKAIDIEVDINNGQIKDKNFVNTSYEHAD